MDIRQSQKDRMGRWDKVIYENQVIPARWNIVPKNTHKK